MRYAFQATYVHMLHTRGCATLHACQSIIYHLPSIIYSPQLKEEECEHNYRQVQVMRPNRRTGRIAKGCATARAVREEKVRLTSRTVYHWSETTTIRNRVARVALELRNYCVGKR